MARLYKERSALTDVCSNQAVKFILEQQMVKRSQFVNKMVCMYPRKIELQFVSFKLFFYISVSQVILNFYKALNTKKGYTTNVKKMQSSFFLHLKLWKIENVTLKHNHDDCGNSRQSVWQKSLSIDSLNNHCR